MSIPNGFGSLPSAHDPPGGVDLDRVWTGIAAEVWRRYPGRAERTAARPGPGPAVNDVRGSGG